MEFDRQHDYRERRLTETEDFTNSCRKFAKEFGRFGDILRIIKEELRGYAHITNTQITESNIYFKDTDPLFGQPSFTYYYTYDDATVNILKIELSDIDPEV